MASTRLAKANGDCRISVRSRNERVYIINVVLLVMGLYRAVDIILLYILIPTKLYPSKGSVWSIQWNPC